MNQNEQHYKVSENTEYILAQLTALHEAEISFYNSLIESFGETKGQEKYEVYIPMFEGIRERIEKELIECIRDNMGQIDNLKNRII